MTRLRLDLAYDGTDFHGWARQKDPQLRTVQGELEKVLELVCREPVNVTVAGRTDAGVHASGQVAHVDVPDSLLNLRGVHGDPSRLVRRFARLLPRDIRLSQVSLAPEGFDARFSALRRHYIYRVSFDPAGCLPTRLRDTLSYPHHLDVQAMDEAARGLVGLHDFAAFCRPKEGGTTIRDLQSFTWQDVSTPEEPCLVEARLSADAFCWNMVRSLVGACLLIGESKKDRSWILRLLEEDQRSSEFAVAKPCGLTLVQVDYPEPEHLAERSERTRELRTL